MSHNTWQGPTYQTIILHSTRFLHITPESHDEHNLGILIRAQNTVLCYTETQSIICKLLILQKQQPPGKPKSFHRFKFPQAVHHSGQYHDLEQHGWQFLDLRLCELALVVSAFTEVLYINAWYTMSSLGLPLWLCLKIYILKYIYHFSRNCFLFISPVYYH